MNPSIKNPHKKPAGFLFQSAIDTAADKKTFQASFLCPTVFSIDSPIVTIKKQTALLFFYKQGRAVDKIISKKDVKFFYLVT
ncbi:MAG: hypothetical protein V9E84_00050 [Trichococcus flocculiformis]